MPVAWFFLFFALSGFASLIDEVVWLRLAMAQFGVTTPLVSLVIAIFMAGLGAGSVAGGRMAARRPGSALRAYGLVEALIGLSAFAVPSGLVAGAALMAAAGTGWNSTAHYAGAAAVLTATMLPFAACMGATIPLGIAAMRGLYGDEARRSFSFLYLANLSGAVAGTLLSAAVLIELLGFRATLRVAAAANFLVSAAAWWWSGRARLGAAPSATVHENAGIASHDRLSASFGDRAALVWLFATGLCSMAMEVVWTRLYTLHLGTVVYAFAVILAVYLAATFAGSRVYRRMAPDRAAGVAVAFLLPISFLLSILPLATAAQRIGAASFGDGVVRLAIGIAPFCAMLGFLTPLLIDRYADGSAARAGVAYAVNIAGCIVGPLLAGFVLLANLSERASLLILAAPLLGGGIWTMAAARRALTAAAYRLASVVAVMSLALAVAIVAATHSLFDDLPPPKIARRDSAATTVAFGAGPDRHLLVNGVGMTTLTPITKLMAHFPLALRHTPAARVLVICFGMGTSYRSALSWGVPVTAVELISSVPGLMPFFHADGADVLRAQLGRIVVDDGRRFLNRETEPFDVVLIDPPPPVNAAGSSLLYSVEMYDAVKRRLAPGGILAQWIPEGDLETFSAVARALTASFPHIRAFYSIEGWGVHFLAGNAEIPRAGADDLAGRIPDAARRDLLEWGPYETAGEQFGALLDNEASVSAIVEGAVVPALSDDRPINEYYILRTIRRIARASGGSMR